MDNEVENVLDVKEYKKRIMVPVLVTAEQEGHMERCSSNTGFLIHTCLVLLRTLLHQSSISTHGTSIKMRLILNSRLKFIFANNN